MMASNRSGLSIPTKSIEIFLNNVDIDCVIQEIMLMYWT